MLDKCSQNHEYYHTTVSDQTISYLLTLVCCFDCKMGKWKRFAITSSTASYELLIRNVFNPVCAAQASSS